MRYIYEIDDNNAIRAWDTEVPNEENLPFLYQPNYPDFTPFASKDEAKKWVELMIHAMIDPHSEFLPGDSAHKPIKLRPQPEALDSEPNLTQTVEEI